MTTSDISWQWNTFHDLSVKELYEVLKLRQEVFVVEQKCVYLDCDGLDEICSHLTAWRESGGKKELIAYLRICPPQSDIGLPAIGRVLTHPAHRSGGLGREIMKRGLEQLNDTYPGKAIRISAQEYLIDFYFSFGFQPSSEMYLEDGIPHLEMILKPSRSVNENGKIQER